MLGTTRIKWIRSLGQKKFRDLYGMFLAEGNKLVSGLLESEIVVETLVATAEFLERTDLPAGIPEVIVTDRQTLARASLLQTPQECLAVCRIPAAPLPAEAGARDLVICLDSIRDPGNLGTMVRLAAWFGITHVVCSHDTADVYNPKAVQATMGALAEVKVHYTALDRFLQQCSQHSLPVYGTFLEGENLYQADLTPNGAVVLGNEGSGIRYNLLPLISRKLTIPGFTKTTRRVESLNVSMAAAILCSEFRRRLLQPAT